MRTSSGFTRRALWAALLAAPLAAKKRKKKDKGGQDSTLGLIAGTVFTSDGLSIPGARVWAQANDEPGAKPVAGVADHRGEFALRVPASTDGRPYHVRAEADGFDGAEKSADAYTGQKTMINLLLSRRK